MVFPAGIAVRVRVALKRCQSAHTCRGVSVSFLRLDVPAKIVSEQPRCACAARSQICLVIDSLQLADGVVLVLRGQAAGGAIGAGQGGFLMVGMGSRPFLLCGGQVSQGACLPTDALLSEKIIGSRLNDYIVEYFTVLCINIIVSKLIHFR